MRRLAVGAAPAALLAPPGGSDGCGASVAASLAPHRLRLRSCCCSFWSPAVADDDDDDEDEDEDDNDDDNDDEEEEGKDVDGMGSVAGASPAALPGRSFVSSQRL